MKNNRVDQDNIKFFQSLIQKILSGIDFQKFTLSDKKFAFPTSEGIIDNRLSISGNNSDHKYDANFNDLPSLKKPKVQKKTENKFDKHIDDADFFAMDDL